MHEENIVKKRWDRVFLKIALVYPNTYSSMAGLTVQTLYNLWNRQPGVLCERFFMPSKLLGTDLHQKQAPKNQDRELPPGKRFPPLKSLESGLRLKDFDIIAFTVSYEMDYTNILWILDNAGIPFYRNKRSQRTDKKNQRNQNDEKYEESDSIMKHPIIIVGGAAVRSNPLPIRNFIDIAFIGELEPVNDKFIRGWKDSYEEWFNSEDSEFNFRNSFFKKVEKIAGFWIPEISNGIDANFDLKIESYVQNNQISRVYAPNLDLIPHPISQIIPVFSDKEKNPFPFGESFFVEVNRGCPHLCKFCMTGCQLKPFRNRSLKKLQEIIKTGIQKTHMRKVVLIGSSVTDHPDFLLLCQFLNNINIRFSIPSIRVDTLTKKTAEILVRGGMKTIAIAPESGSDALRKKIGKRISNEEIIQGVKILKESGIPNIKLYLLYGLPGETEQEAISIIDLVHKIADLGFGKYAVRVSLNPFIPKAHTPFETAFQNYLDPNMKFLKDQFNRIYLPLKGNKQVKFESLSLEEAYVQSILALGDGTFDKLIEKYYLLGRNYRKWYKFTKNPKNQFFDTIKTYFKELEKTSYIKRPWRFLKFDKMNEK
ncbi:MAG: B12-binding domain-containing radical SAM protein [Promethearchaeota archaeon]